MAYTALILDEESRMILLNRFPIPLDWEIICHHMTINLGLADKGPAIDLVGHRFEVVAKTFAENNLVMAVGVESIVPSTNNIKHITLAVNAKDGGKAKNSNKLIEWIPFDQITLLYGTVQVII